MSHQDVLLIYHSKKMLLTLDLNTVVEILLAEFGDALNLAFRPMNPEELAAFFERYLFGSRELPEYRELLRPSACTRDLNESRSVQGCRTGFVR